MTTDINKRIANEIEQLEAAEIEKIKKGENKINKTLFLEIPELNLYFNKYRWLAFYNKSPNTPKSQILEFAYKMGGFEKKRFTVPFSKEKIEKNRRKQESIS